MVRAQSEILNDFQSLEARTDGSKLQQPDCKCLHVSVPPVVAIMCMPICVCVYSRFIPRLQCFHRQMK